jgi:hypothetical protein
VEQCVRGLQRMGCLKENYIQATECVTTKKNSKQNMPKFEENPKLKDEMIFQGLMNSRTMDYIILLWMGCIIHVDSGLDHS